MTDRPESARTTHRMPGRAVALATLALAAAVALELGTPSGPAVAATSRTAELAPAVSYPAASWPTYHRTQDRTGYVPGIPSPRRLVGSWSQKLDGQVYAQPLVVGNLLIVATERNSVYAYSLGNHALVWHRRLAPPDPSSSLPCGNIGPFVGITGTPVYDRTTGSVYVVAESTGASHALYSLAIGNGALRWRRSVDLAGRQRSAEQQRGALAVANGRVYVPLGGRYGDCGNYAGYVASWATSGAGRMTTYVAVTPSSREGGIWSTPGVAVGPDGTVFVSVGNGAATNNPWDGSDSVVRLTPALHRIDYFRPGSWASENAADLDLGSSGPVLLPGGRVLISGKAGDVYLLGTARLGAMRTPLAHVTGCAAYGGDAYDPVRHEAFLPCESGLARIDVGTRSLTPRWSVGDSGSPVVAAGLVWYQSGGTLTARYESTGRVWRSIAVGPTSRFASPVVLAGRVIIGTLAGVTVLRTT